MVDDTTDALPVVDPPVASESGGGLSSESTVAGVVLAAGESSRFGDENKLLADVDGEPMVRRSVKTLLDAELDHVVVVVGHEAGAVRAALDGLDVRTVENPEYRTGQASTLRAGVRAIEDTSGSEGPVDAAVFALGDMPYVDPSSVEALVAAYDAGLGSALAAGVDGERGNPVLFDRRHFGALADRDGDVGGLSVLRSAPDATVVETGDPGVRRDVDRPDEFE